jgi:hypothetical protein
MDGARVRTVSTKRILMTVATSSGESASPNWTLRVGTVRANPTSDQKMNMARKVRQRMKALFFEFDLIV